MSAADHINERLIKMGLGDKKYADVALSTNTLLPKGVAGPILPGQAGFADAMTQEALGSMMDEKVDDATINRLSKKMLWSEGGDPRIDNRTQGGYSYHDGMAAANEHINFMIDSDPISLEDYLVHKKKTVFTPEPDASVDLKTGKIGWRPEGNETRDQVEAKYKKSK